MKKTAAMHHINDEVMVDELIQIAQAMMSGALPGPGGGGTPNVTQPGTAQAGAAAGINNIRGGRPS